jgi:hypothetical protein
MYTLLHLQAIIYLGVLCSDPMPVLPQEGSNYKALFLFLM